MKSLLLLVTLFSAFSVFSQIKTAEKRIEIELKDGFRNERVYEFDENGFVIASKSEKSETDEIQFRYQRYSTDLVFLDEKYTSIPVGYQEIINYVDEDFVYTLFMDRLGKIFINQFNAKTADIRSTTGDLNGNRGIKFLRAYKDHVVIIYVNKKGWFMYNLNLTSGEGNIKPIIIEGAKPNRIEVKNIQFVLETESFYISMNGIISKKIKSFLAQYNLNSEEVGMRTLDQDTDKNFISTSIAALDKKDIIISGTYANRYSTFSTGIYITTTIDEELQSPNFYNYVNLDNFLSYLPESKQQRIENKKERLEDKGKGLEISYNIAMHNIVRCNEDYLFIGEAYYPTYTTELKTKMVNGVPTTTTQMVFDGYQYTHAVIAKFNKKGELLWSQCFKLNPNEKPKYVEKYIRIAGQKQNSIKLVYAIGSQIFGKEFDFDGNVISEETAEINGLSENDDVRSSNSKIVYWYDQYFLTFGYQRIKNITDIDTKRNRQVIFVNKIKFE